MLCRNISASAATSAVSNLPRQLPRPFQICLGSYRGNTYFRAAQHGAVIFDQNSCAVMCCAEICNQYFRAAQHGAVILKEFTLMRHAMLRGNNSSSEAAAVGYKLPR